MSFYGNLPNISRAQFQFDKIYPNRKAMEESSASDHVFVGRYILIEYDTVIDEAIYKIRVYRNDEDFRINGYLNAVENGGDGTRISYTESTDYIDDTSGEYNISYGVYEGVIVWVQEEDLSRTYYECIGRNGGYATFRVIDSDNNYVFNYNQDRLWAQETENPDFGKGWDSTVWQKVYADGQIKYIQIAELNTVTPTFKISADPPTIAPTAPHLDENSNNLYYTLHWQPSWGARVKSARKDITGPILDKNGEEASDSYPYILRSIYHDDLNYPSDVNTVWTKQEYNVDRDVTTNYYYYIPQEEGEEENLNGTWLTDEIRDWEYEQTLKKAKQGIPAAIYFNKDGFDVNKVIRSEDMFDGNRLSKFDYVSAQEEWPERKITDMINFSPTGLSGHKYNQHAHNALQRPDVDTYEFSVMLPSIGDTISSVWDLVYGGRDTNNTIKETSIRNTDISWEDARLGSIKSGLRLFSLINGTYAYKPLEINTIAGCINTAHDVMGMIIYDTTNTDMDFEDQNKLDNLSSELIYYYGGSFFRKRKFYNYVAPEQGQSLRNYEKIDLIPFEQNKYYDKLVSNYILITSIPQDGRSVYIINDSEGENPEEIGTFSDTYIPNAYYYKFKKQNSEYFSYYIDMNPAPTEDRVYVSLYKKDEEGNTIYETDENGNILSYPYFYSFRFYQPDLYYYEDGEDQEGNKIMQPDDGEEIDPEKQYYIQRISRIWNEETQEYTITYNYQKVNQGELVMFEANRYYQQTPDGTGYEIMESIPINAGTNYVSCWVIPYVSEDIMFYQSNHYYYSNGSNWLLDSNPTYTQDRIYYKAPNATEIENPLFYKPGIYYYGPDEDHVTLDAINGTFNPNTFYWKKVGKYVAEDLNSIYTIGIEWDDSVEVPNGVTLGNVEEVWGVEELKGFGINSNTMLGLLLQINNVLDTEHSDTRNPKTIQGALNRVNDLFSRFGKRRPGQVMITNNYSQIAGASQTSAQIYSNTNYGKYDTTTNSFITSTPTVSQENQWIYWNVDTNYLDPIITLQHRLVSEMSHTATNTTTVANKNNNTAVSAGQFAGLNFGAGDTLDLYTPIVDAAGHIVGRNTETVTLPFGFKTIHVTNSSAVTDAASTILAAGQIADNTQDELTFASTNKWLKLDNNTEDTIKVGHLVQSIDQTANSTTNLNEETGANDEENIDIPDFTFDEAGHIRSKKSHTYTLPFGFKILKSLAQSEDDSAWSTAAGVETQIVADTTQDTLTFATGNKWLRIVPDATNDKLTFAHSTSTATAGSYGDSAAQTPAFGSTFSVPYITIDVAGHVSGLSAHNVTIPKGSLSDTAANGADVITQLSFTDTSGALSTTRTNIGSLLLTGYSLGTDTSVLAATDTVNEAFSKLQAKINTFGNIVTHSTNDFDAAGAASNVLGTNQDTATSNTVYGAKAYADALAINEIPVCPATLDEEEDSASYVLICTITRDEEDIIKQYHWNKITETYSITLETVQQTSNPAMGTGEGNNP